MCGGREVREVRQNALYVLAFKSLCFGGAGDYEAGHGASQAFWRMYIGWLGALVERQVGLDRARLPGGEYFYERDVWRAGF